VKQIMDEHKIKENPYCKKCGKSLPDRADYCPACGETTHKTGITYVKHGNGGVRGGQVIAILIGGLLILVSVPILFAGGALLGVNGVLDQGGGYIGVDDIDFVTSTYAIVGKELDIEDVVIDGDGPPGWVWEPTVGDFVTFKVSADSNEGKDVFIGIVEDDDAMMYLKDVEYDYLTEFNMDDYRRDPHIQYRRHSGGELTTLPTETDIWVAEVSGPGEQTLRWSPEPGNYWLVIMNEDGSPDVNVETGLAVKVPILGNIGGGLFLGGFVVFAMGVAIVYFGAIKPR
jgi:hypothetical protein